MNQTHCPTEAELSRFALGDLPRLVLARLAEHVEHCPACETALGALDERGDALLRQLRLADDAAEKCADDAPLGPLLEAARVALRQRPAPGWLSPNGARRLGKFELLEELGMGSYGYVFRARDTELDRIVAIKILRAGRLAGRDDIERFLREARSAAQLKHPGVVSLYDSGQTDDGTCYLVEEFVPGTTLAERLRRGSVSDRQAAAWIADVADALDYAHRHGVIHRDIKPSNIILDDEGRPHLADFGLAKREADEVPFTPDGQVLGTPAYMSPEQASGDTCQVGARSDQYSLGVVLYELSTGEQPFHGNRRMLLLQVLEDEPRAPRRLNDRIARDLETICLKAMAKSPARRYATSGELAEDLRRWLRGDAIRARPIGAAERLRRWCRRNPVAASLLLAVSLGSAFGLWHLSRLSAQLVQSTALESAAQESEMLAVVNEDYSKIVERLAPRKVVVTHDYALREGAIPLPATLTIDLGRHISQKSASGMQVRLYSDHPFRQRTDSGARDAFERAALDQSSLAMEKPFWSFEDFQGRPSLRYATARRMEETCVRCHNTHLDSPKKDWKVGDVAGVLEIIRPLDRDISRAKEGLRGTFILMGIISAGLLGVCGLLLVMGNRRRP
ncbi:MAG TPA: protein kinase [Pirellulales bacterium]|nr:protein kinase [Pirellulales bacterium]